MGWEDFATFGKYGIISLKLHKIGIQLLWRTNEDVIGGLSNGDIADDLE